MNCEVLLSPIPLEALKAEIQQIIKQELANKEKADLKERLLSPAEACNIFQPKISKVTLWKWTKEGRLQEHRMGNRVFYKYSELLASLQTLRKYKRIEPGQIQSVNTKKG